MNITSYKGNPYCFRLCPIVNRQHFMQNEGFTGMKGSWFKRRVCGGVFLAFSCVRTETRTAACSYIRDYGRPVTCNDTDLLVERDFASLHRIILLLVIDYSLQTSVSSEHP